MEEDPTEALRGAGAERRGAARRRPRASSACASRLAEYWDLLGTLLADGGRDPVRRTPDRGRRPTASALAIGKDFDPDTGELKSHRRKDRVHLDEPKATRTRRRASRGKTGQGRVVGSRRSPTPNGRHAPFTTSTLQQEAGASSASRPSARCAPRSGCTRTATSPTCVPTRRRCRQRGDRCGARPDRTRPTALEYLPEQPAHLRRTRSRTRRRPTKPSARPASSSSPQEVGGARPGPGRAPPLRIDLASAPLRAR